MSILIKAGTGLFAGVIAGALGLAFLPQVEPNGVQPRRAVEKPQFVVAAAPLAPVRAEPAVAIAAEAAAKPAPSTLAEPVEAAKVKPAPSRAEAAPIAVAKLEPPKAAASPAATLAAAQTPPATPAPAAPASAEAARWSVQGLVALSKGDLSSARQFLTRAAEAGDPRAWVALADTYDPAMLAKFGVVCAPGDAQRAKDYLSKAAAAGIVGAKDRMAALDQTTGAIR